MFAFHICTKLFAFQISLSQHTTIEDMEANRNVKLLKAIIHVNRALAFMGDELSHRNVGSSPVDSVKKELELEKELQWKHGQAHILSSQIVHSLMATQALVKIQLKLC